MTYNGKLDTDQQITMEEQIAKFIYDFPLRDDSYVDEDNANEMGRRILAMVLTEFRRDYVADEFWDFGDGVEDWTGLGLLEEDEDGEA